MIVLDTETTGLDNDAEIVEIAIIDSWGTPLLNTLVKPKTPITPEVTAINGITNEMLKDAPCWEVIRPLVKTIFEDNCFDLPQDKSEFHKAYAYNAKFDQRMLIQSGWEGKPPEIICAMERAIHHLKIDQSNC
ncbi:3'-5' exonuclease [Rappaport israeli]|uniref:3'-5' exonuclease n=1 Tax=Rappaport israeli TaxID=1839807 RepID=UPI000930099D|nr:3'-5' exonuclease [Rappaport israeli]